MVSATFSMEEFQQLDKYCETHLTPTGRLPPYTEVIRKFVMDGIAAANALEREGREKHEESDANEQDTRTEPGKVFDAWETAGVCQTIETTVSSAKEEILREIRKRKTLRSELCASISGAFNAALEAFVQTILSLKDVFPKKAASEAQNENSKQKG